MVGMPHCGVFPRGRTEGVKISVSRPFDQVLDVETKQMVWRENFEARFEARKRGVDSRQRSEGEKRMS
jgi:hypothetical protein